MSAKAKLASREGKPKRHWLKTTTRDELRDTIGWGQPRRTRTQHCLSAHHPLIPRRYVPEWQSDMRNRALIVQVS